MENTTDKSVIATFLSSNKSQRDFSKVVKEDSHSYLSSLVQSLETVKTDINVYLTQLIDEEKQAQSGDQVSKKLKADQ